MLRESCSLVDLTMSLGANVLKTTLAASVSQQLHGACSSNLELSEKHCSPSSVELHVCVEQSDNRGRSCPPAAHSGPDQSFLLIMADHLDEPRAVLHIGLIHKVLQMLL